MPLSNSPAESREDTVDILSRIDSVLRSLEFQETPDFRTIRTSLLTDSSPEKRRLLLGAFEEEVQGRVAPDASPEEYMRMEVACILWEAKLFLELGDNKRYEEEITSAIDLAHGIGDAALMNSLDLLL